MSYRVVIAHEAEKILDRMDRPTEKRIRTRILQLAEDPFDPRALGAAHGARRRPKIARRRLADSVCREPRNENAGCARH